MAAETDNLHICKAIIGVQRLYSLKFLRRYLILLAVGRLVTCLTTTIAYELLLHVLLAHVVVIIIHVSTHTVLSHNTASYYLVKLTIHPVFLLRESSQFSQ